MIGGTITVLLVTNAQISGRIITTDRKTKVMVLENGGEYDTTYTFINTTHITKILSFKQVEQTGRKENERWKLIEKNAAKKRKERSIGEFKKRMKHFGHNVTNKGQRTFDFLIKQLPVEWDGEDIVYGNDVRIKPKYDVSDVIGRKKLAVQQLKKLVHISPPRLNGPMLR